MLDLYLIFIVFQYVLIVPAPANTCLHVWQLVEPSVGVIAYRNVLVWGGSPLPRCYAHLAPVMRMTQAAMCDLDPLYGRGRRVRVISAQCARAQRIAHRFEFELHRVRFKRSRESAV